MKKTLQFALLFISLGLNSQIQNFCEYQKKINEAELLVTDGKKHEALKKYLKTFQSISGNFGKDLYNALVVADELNSIDTFYLILSYLKTKGLKNDYLTDKIEFIKNHINDAEMLKFLNENSKYICPNPKLREQIESLHFKDQEFRKKEGSYKVYRDTIKKIDSQNMLFIYSLVEQNRFPGEDEIGIKNFWNTQTYDIVFTHYCQSTSIDSNRKKPKITSIIVNLVQQGKLTPNRASQWLDMQQSDYNGGVFDVISFIVKGKETGFYVPKLPYSKKIIVNECRKWLCLEPLQDYYKKFVWKANNSKSKISFDVSRNKIDLGDDEDSFKKFIQNMELIE
jgi:hypothetical protein